MMTPMIRVLALILSAISWPSLVCRALGGGAPRPLPQLAALAPVATLPAVAAVPVAATRSGRLALALAVPAAVLTCWQLPPRRSGTASGQHGRELRVLSLNMEGGKAEAEHLTGVLRDLRVDVLAAQEVTPEAVTMLERAGLADLLPDGVVDARPGSAGSAIWSRSPLRPADPLTGLASAAPRAVLSLAGRSVTLCAVHLLAPVKNRDQSWQRELMLLRSLPRTVDGPQVVAGDFNASRDHRPFRRLLATGFLECADSARRRRWPAVTWPSGSRIRPVMRLDHVLVSRDHFEVQECRTVLVPGTDHRGVLAVVRLREQAAAGRTAGR